MNHSPLATHLAEVTLSIEGVEAALQVQQLSGSSGMCQSLRCSVEICTHAFGLAPLSLLGQQATLTLQPKEAMSQAVSGVVTSFSPIDKSNPALSLVQSSGPVAYYRLVIESPLVALKHSSHTRRFHNQSVPVILQQLLTEKGIHGASVEHVKDDYPQRVVTTQLTESDYGFFMRLCEEEGIAWYESVSAKARHAGLDPASRENNLILFSDRLSGYRKHSTALAEQVPKPHDTNNKGQSLNPSFLYYMDQTQQHVNRQLQGQTYSAASPNATVRAKVGGVGHLPHSANTHNVYPLLTNDHSDVTSLLQKHLTAKQQSKHLKLTAISNNLTLTPGTQINLNSNASPSHQTAMQSEWLITKVEYHYQIDNESENKDSKENKENKNTQVFQQTIHAIPTQVFRPELKHHKPKPRSLSQATVIGPKQLKDQQVYNNAANHVKVRFAWEECGDNKNNPLPTQWTRTLLPLAGEHYGWQLVPRLNQSVAIYYAQSDLDQPMIVGCLYNANHNPAFDIPAQGSAYQSGLKTQAGHSLHFDDTPNHEQLNLTSTGDYQVDVDHNHSTQVGNGQNTNIKGKQQITTKGAYTVKASKAIILKAKDSHITITPHDITFSAPMITLNSPNVQKKSEDWSRIVKDISWIGLGVIGEIVETAGDEAGIGEVAQVETGEVIAKEADDLEAAVKDEGYRGYHRPPERLKAFSDAKRVRPKTYNRAGKKRIRWQDKKGRIYEWDSRHGAVEKYDRRGNHLGEFDPETGKQLKPAVKSRRVDP